MMNRFIILFSLVGLFLLFTVFSLPADVLDQWTTNQVSFNNFGLRCVTYGNGHYIAAGGWSDWGVVLSSEDGQNWTLRSNGGGPSGSFLAFVESLVYGGGRFVTVGYWGGTGVSTDGTNWLVGFVPDSPSFGLLGIAYGTNGNYVAVGGGATVSNVNIFASADGLNWSGQSSSSPAGSTIGDVAYGAGRFVAIGINNGAVNDSGHIYTSSTGTNSPLQKWSQHNIPGGSLISFCRGIFIVPFNSGTNLLSADGITWVMQRTGLTNLLGKVTYANGLFLARAGGCLATSTDGTNWIQSVQMVPGTSVVASDGSHLVTVGNNIFAFGPYSANGYTYYSGVLVGIRLINTAPAQIALSGLVGRSYQIQSMGVLSSDTNGWQTNIVLQLPGTPYVWTDPAATNSQRFYRAALLP